jgi:hypothetical protein
MADTRHVIVHFHIFKNAGATIDAILKKNFGSRWAAVEGKPLTYRLSDAELLEHIQGNPNLVAVSSHEARPPAVVPGGMNLKVHPILFLRHPIDRIGSIYSYRRSQTDDSTRSVKVALESDLAGYIRWCLDNPSSEPISNFQTRFLSSSDADPWNAPDLGVALQRLRDMPFWGLVEFFDQSLSLIQSRLFEVFGKLDFGYTIVNKSLGRKHTIQERLREIQTILGPGLYEELLDVNSLDLKLYEEAIRIFERETALGNIQ